MGWSVYYVTFQAQVTVDCHGGPRETEEEALYEDLRRRLVSVVNAGALTVMQDPKYAAIRPEWEASDPERHD
jgi:hypothetical protein